jgi:hypothetical protein
MGQARWRSFGSRLSGRWLSGQCGAGRRQVVDAGIRRHDWVARACDGLGPASGTTDYRATRSDRSDSHQIKFPISRNEGFTESNLLGEKAA